MRARSWFAASALLLALLGCRDDATSPAEAAPASPQVTVTTATPLVFRQISAGGEFTCGVTADNLGYCWGNDFPGTLGNGSQGVQFCMDWDACVTRPVAVAGDLPFRVVTSGSYHACAITTDDRAYCWGSSGSGSLGNGTTTGPETCDGNESQRACSSRPVAVVGGRRFRSVSAGGAHTCGIAADSLAYCWGYNHYGQLGDGTTVSRPRPTAVAGGRHFRAVSTGLLHTCGITTANQSFCWGANGSGQLGDSTPVTQRLRPVRVAGALSFVQLDAGDQHTCAVTATNRAFCWGNGGRGQLGTGRTSLSRWPRAVAGGLSFSRVTVGRDFTCGEATSKQVYCWGYNFYGQLGDGSTTTRLTPVAVTGGLFFSQASAGEGHTCGRTRAGAAYCWGQNWRGDLGDGTTDSRQTPTAVVGP